MGAGVGAVHIAYWRVRVWRVCRVAACMACVRVWRVCVYGVCACMARVQSRGVYGVCVRTNVGHAGRGRHVTYISPDTLPYGAVALTTDNAS